MAFDGVIEAGLIVRCLYRALLDREPDQAGFEYYRSRLADGELTPHQLAMAILSGSEFLNKQQHTGNEFIGADDIRLYPGYSPQDLDVFTSFLEAKPQPRSGFVTDFVGSVARLSLLWDGLEHLDGQVLPLPVPSDYRADAVEWIGVLKSVLAAEGAFAAMELGAGHGPWIAAGAAAARLRGIEHPTLWAVEADPGRFQLLQQNAIDNGLEGRGVRLIQAAVGIADGTVRWPKITHPRNATGCRPLREGNREDREYLGKWGEETQEIEVVALDGLLRSQERWDLLHVDVQGWEAELCRNCLTTLGDRVRYLVIGTHSRKLDGDLMEMLLGAGWQLEHERPARLGRLANAASPIEMTTAAGTQVWRNPRVGPGRPCARAVGTSSSGVQATQPVLVPPPSAQSVAVPAGAATARHPAVEFLMAQLCEAPFANLPRYCGNDTNPGIDEVPAQIWTNRETTIDQKRIEDYLDAKINPTTRILHIGVGNSSLAQRFISRVDEICGTTLHIEELNRAVSLNFSNYFVCIENKYAPNIQCNFGHNFDVIIDNNPSSFACCLFHFCRMMAAYAEALNDGGIIISSEPGLSWVIEGKPGCPLGWEPWARLANLLGLRPRRLTDFVYAMERRQTEGETRWIGSVAETGARASQQAVTSGYKVMQIETSNYCSLQCVYCPHPSQGRPKGNMSMETFRKCMDLVARSDNPTRDGFKFVWLNHFGEPLLNPLLPTFISYANSRRIKVSFASNGLDEDGKPFSKDLWRQLAKSGLEHVILSAHKGNEKLLRNQVADMVKIDTVWTPKKENLHDWAGQVDMAKFNLALVGEPATPCDYAKDNMFAVTWDGRIASCCYDIEGRVGMSVDDVLARGFVFREISLCRGCRLGRGDASWLLPQ